MSRKTEDKPFARQVRELVEALIIAGVFLWFANTFVVKTFYIPSASMEDTLLIGDHLFVNRFIYGPEPGLLGELLPARPVERGDIVIFRSPEDPTVDVVKRCIAVPGDVVEVRSKQLYINGERVVDDSYAHHRDPRTFADVPAYDRQSRRRDNMSAYRVPEDHYFCMGDNRDFSYDSRFWGPLPAHLVKGRASLIYWSYGGEVSDGTPQGAGAFLGRLLRTLGGFFTQTRWDRTFHMVR